MLRQLHLWLFAIVACLLVGRPVAAASLEQQRELFLAVYPSVERGDWSPIDTLSAEEQALLQEYALWPDLRATWLRARILTADHDEVEAFLQQYGTLRPARELRYRYALHLAAASDLAGFLTIYEEFYQGLNIAKLDCLALQAELKIGRRDRIAARAKDLWTVGKSQVDECDPVFRHLGKSQLLTAADYKRRFELAIDAREFTRARWLAKSIDQKHIDIASQWIRAQRNPETFVRRHRQWLDDPATLNQLVYAIERITYRDPVRALEHWKDVLQRQEFPPDQEHGVWRHIALWMARDRLPGAYDALVSLPVGPNDEEILRWRARTSLREGNWQNLVLDIGAMTEAERDTEDWRFWHAVALKRLGRAEESLTALTTLAAERSYYGFLAADELGMPYALNASAIVADEEVIAKLEEMPELVRARELYFVRQDSRGRSEWQSAVNHLAADEKVQAAILAQRWGWHSRAIASAASVGEYDDLALRYPLPYLEAFESLSAEAGIPHTWAYSVARSESLFMRDIRSHAGAIGLMQLMPATGRQVARELRLPFSGQDTLTDPDSNIRLGTTYLGQMAERFGGNRVLATAAYNAGPHRVAQWLPGTGSLDARIWIESIPFNETRKYVRRVLEAETIFHWRMTGERRRLSDHLPEVSANLIASR